MSVGLATEQLHDRLAEAARPSGPDRLAAVRTPDTLRQVLQADITRGMRLARLPKSRDWERAAVRHSDRRSLVRR